MNKAGALLAARIISELKELSVLAKRAGQGLKKAKEKNDDYYLDGVALNLHSIYSGLERIFERIATAIDGSIPSGTNWHRELLNQMAIEVPGIRPAVISSDLKEKLEEYRGFRHVVRNVYTYRLKPEKIEGLVSMLNTVMTKIETDINGFAKFLQSIE
jgi:hypothetical protein